MRTARSVSTLQQHGGSSEEQDVQVQEKQPVGFQVGEEIEHFQGQVVRSTQCIDIADDL